MRTHICIAWQYTKNALNGSIIVLYPYLVPPSGRLFHAIIWAVTYYIKKWIVTRWGQKCGRETKPDAIFGFKRIWFSWFFVGHESPIKNLLWCIRRLRNEKSFIISIKTGFPLLGRHLSTTCNTEMYVNHLTYDGL